MQRYDDNDVKDNTFTRKTDEAKEVANDKSGEVFVKNLAFKTTNEECQKFFEQFGKVKNVNILQRDSRSRGVGFVTFEDPKDAIALIESKKELILEERPLSVSWPSSQKQEKSQKSNTIFVGNLSYRATEKGIEDFFSDCGKVVSVRVAFEYDGRSKGFCYVDFDTEEAVTTAVNNKNGKLFEEREIRVDKALPKSSGDRYGNGEFRGRGRGRGRGFGGRGFGGRGFGGRGYGGRGRGRGRGRDGFNYDEPREYYEGRGRGERGRGRGRGENDNSKQREYRGRGTENN